MGRGAITSNFQSARVRQPSRTEMSQRLDQARTVIGGVRRGEVMISSLEPEYASELRELSSFVRTTVIGGRSRLADDLFDLAALIRDRF